MADAQNPVTAWDADGNPVASSGSISVQGPTTWDASGNPIQSGGQPPAQQPIPATPRATLAGIPLPHIQVLEQAGKALANTSLGRKVSAVGDWLNKPENQMALSQIGVPDLEAVEGVEQTVKNALSPVSNAVSGAKDVAEQAVKGEGIAQPAAQGALRSGVQGATDLATTQPASLRTIAEEPIAKLDSSAKGLYRQIDQAAGTDFKALNEKLSNTEYQIRQLTETEEDVAKESKLEASRTAIMDKIEAAKQAAKEAGVDPKVLDQADAQFKQARALSDLETKVFKNTGVIKGNAASGSAETVDVDKAVTQLQKLMDKTRYGGSRLEQALGKDGARALLDNMYEAQRSGQKAIKVQQVAKWVASVIGAGSVAAGYEALK